MSTLSYIILMMFLGSATIVVLAIYSHYRYALAKKRLKCRLEKKHFTPQINSLDFGYQNKFYSTSFVLKIASYHIPSIDENPGYYEDEYFLSIIASIAKWKRRFTAVLAFIAFCMVLLFVVLPIVLLFK